MKVQGAAEKANLRWAGSSRQPPVPGQRGLIPGNPRERRKVVRPLGEGLRTLN